MIDLHMHTLYSDGTDSVLDILKKASTSELEIISITDHNQCGAYQELDTISISDFYTGKIITGCEFTTSFEHRLIEVLGYGFDYHKVQSYLDSYYTKEAIEERTSLLYHSLITKMKELGLIFALEQVRDKKFDNEFFERGIYDELVKHPENKELLGEDIFSSFSDFFRRGLTNPTSKLYLDYPKYKPALKDIIDLVHRAGGIVFLAHPFQYKFADTEEFLDRIYEECDFDGIECFYTTFSQEQSEFLVKFAKERDLFISGGSDYHGGNKKQHELGVGRGNLHIDKGLISSWDVEYYFNG